MKSFKMFLAEAWDDDQIDLEQHNLSQENTEKVLKLYGYDVKYSDRWHQTGIYSHPSGKHVAIRFRNGSKTGIALQATSSRGPRPSLSHTFPELVKNLDKFHNDANIKEEVDYDADDLTMKNGVAIAQAYNYTPSLTSNFGNHVQYKHKNGSYLTLSKLPYNTPLVEVTHSYPGCINPFRTKKFQTLINTLEKHHQNDKRF